VRPGISGQTTVAVPGLGGLLHGRHRVENPGAQVGDLNQVRFARNIELGGDPAALMIGGM
jgi:hypothetical protein